MSPFQLEAHRHIFVRVVLTRMETASSLKSLVPPGYAFVRSNDGSQ
jgi:hypothetical protein